LAIGIVNNTHASERKLLHSVLYLLAIIGASFSLRIIYTSISPLQLDIQYDLNASYSDFGLLASLAQFCAGICSFAFPFLLRRYNPEQIGFLALLLLSTLLLSPLLLSSMSWFYAFVIIVGTGIAISQPALQAVIKHYFPHHTMQVVALMVLCMHLGSSFASIATISFAQQFGDWRWSLFSFGMISLFGAIIWLLVFLKQINRRINNQLGTQTAPVTHLYFSKTTWLIVLYFTSSGVIYISLLAWLPDFFHQFESGSDSVASMLGIFVLSQAIAAFLLTLFSRDHWDKRKLLYLSTLLVIAAIAVAEFASSSMIILFPILAGLGLGISFPVAMSLPHSYGKTHQETATLSMFGLGLGSAFSAPSPFIIGWLKDHTQFENILIWVALLNALIMLLTAYRLTPPAKQN
jgi:CP family cyanate transporter-like MFS transporter